MRLSKTPLSTRTPTPTLGQHNDYVFGELLGLGADDLAGLHERGIIGTEPTEAARRGRL
jgi:formyl-CoA transferase